MREFQIQVNCIAPWFVATEPVKQFYPAEAQKALPPDEIAGLAAFLLSGDADHMSGQIIDLRSKHDW